MTYKRLLALAIATSLLTPAAAMSAPEEGMPAKKRAAVTVTKKWRGYGFLPGYPRTERERQIRKYRSETRFFDWRGNVYYGFGRPGYYRGQWNGGSIGPCY